MDGFGESAFSGCTGLTSIEIPASVREIGERAFEGVKSVSIADSSKITLLRSTTTRFLVLKENIAEIGDRVFNVLPDLEGIELPNSINKIGDEAFRGCTRIKEIYCRIDHIRDGYVHLDATYWGHNWGIMVGPYFPP